MTIGWEQSDHACNDTNFCCNQLYIPLCCCLPGPLDDDEKLTKNIEAAGVIVKPKAKAMWQIRLQKQTT